MNYTLLSIAFCLVLFVAMVSTTYGGYYLAKRKAMRCPEIPDNGSITTVTGATFALLGLFFAFTFSGAFSRLDARRTIIVNEYNSISTAYLRIDFVSPEKQRQLREKFDQYIASRIRLWDVAVDYGEAVQEWKRAQSLQEEIWRLCVDAVSEEGYEGAKVLLINAVNQMFDIATTRTTAMQTHPPKLIFFTLGLIAIICAGLVGYSSNKRHKLSHVHVAGFAFIVSLILYVILDVEYPRYGLVTLHHTNLMIKDLRHSL